MGIKYIHPVKPGSAKGLVSDVYVQVKRDFGRIAEPFMMHSPLPQLLAGVWMVCRETELVGNAHREAKEAVAAAISKINGCSYCVDAHTIILIATGEKQTANAIANGLYSHIADTKIRLTVEWALATISPTSPVLRSPPFSLQEAPEIIGTAIFYHYINRIATILLNNTPLPFNQTWLKSSLKQVASKMFTPAFQRPKSHGDSLQFLPKTDLPNDLRWTKNVANVAGAYARFAAAIEKAGEYALPVTVRAFIQEEIDTWRGETSELRLAWSEDAISRFDEPAQAAAYLALLTALSPHEVDEKVVLAFKKHFPEDDKLVGAIAWSSFTTARKISSWIPTPKT